MYGCDWDDETEEVNAHMQYGYDGEDFIAMDFKKQAWVAPKPQAVITKHKWENNKAKLAQDKNYFTQLCPEWLKKYVEYGKSSLMRTGKIIHLVDKNPLCLNSMFSVKYFEDIVAENSN